MIRSIHGLHFEVKSPSLWVLRVTGGDVRLQFLGWEWALFLTPDRGPTETLFFSTREAAIAAMTRR